MSSRQVSRVASCPSWEAAIVEHRQVLDACSDLGPTIARVAQLIHDCLLGDGTVFVCGNGGSHAHATHLAAELVVRYRKSRSPMAAVALGCNPAVLTAVINDLDPVSIFERELIALAGPGDLLFAISTSGNSANVCRALFVAVPAGLTTIGLTGANGMNAWVHHEIRVPSTNTARIQEVHTMIIHALCEALDA